MKTKKQENIGLSNVQKRKKKQKKTDKKHGKKKQKKNRQKAWNVEASSH